MQGAAPAVCANNVRNSPKHIVKTLFLEYIGIITRYNYSNIFAEGKIDGEDGVFI